jgi:outer membrane protein OmpA-like peptidoglycan-associated protein
MRSRSTAAACAAFLLGLGANASAQESAEVSDEAPDLSPVDMGFELGLFLGGFFPSDEHEFYDYKDTMQTPLEGAGPDLGLRAGFYPLRFLGVELEGDLMPFSTENGQSALLYGVRGSIVAQAPGIAADGRFTPFLLGGFGTMGVSSDAEVLSDDADKVAHLGVGVKFQMNRLLMFRLDGRYYRAPKVIEAGATEDPRDGTNHFAVLAGLSLTLGRPAAPEEPEAVDTDGDGIADETDKCPREAGDPPDGCPKAKDSDGDGIMDDVDRCKTEPETVNSFEDDDGCPDQVPDKDGDGLSDALDSCVDQPEDVDGFEDTDGCPDPDDDKDGVLDNADKCPREAGPVENRGCPDTDRDKDGVVDRLDNCPDEPGTAANHGCKKKQLVQITQTSLKILDKVYFNTNKATIQKRSNRLLNNVATVIINHPDIPKIRIEGHTDDKGKDDYNKDLSQRRADRVRMYLIEKGVPEDRLEAVGFGEEKPVADNTSAKGRAANRRVEFNFADAAPVTTPVPEPGTDSKAPEPGKGTKAPEAPKTKMPEKKDETLKPPP